MIYLDGHSTTSLDPEAYAAMKPYFMERFGNASHGVHRLNWEAEAGLEHAREQIAKLLACHTKEIIFTSGATESNHLALLGLVSHFESGKRRKILSIEIEHASLLGPLEMLSDRGFQIVWVRVHPDGRVDEEDYRSKLDENVALVSIAHANHEIGTIQNIEKLSRMAHEVGALFHTDAVQTFGKLRYTVDSLGVDLLTLSAHKIYGPKGTGALFVRRKNPRVELEPLFWGGSQERGMRPGTPNTPAIVGFGMAAEIADRTLEQEGEKLAQLRNLLWSQLKSRLPCLIRNGSEEHALPHNLNVSVTGLDGAALFGRLKNVAVSNASACLNGTQDYSQVLTVLGVKKSLAKATLRFGVGRFNTEDEILKAVDEVVETVLELRKMEKEFAELSGIAYQEGECLK